MEGNSVPQYFLLTETFDDPNEAVGGQWRFILQQSDGEHRLEVSDMEPGMVGERLQLLAVVRGLEAIDGHAHVTLVTSSRYVGQGIRFGLDQWRDRNWQWERFGEMTQINNLDLWQRVDRALQFHSIECRVWRLKSRSTQPAPATQPVANPVRKTVGRWLQMPAAVAQRFAPSQWLPKYGCAAN
ncbi:MAG: RNase H family protein [Pirellulaceae bacterium]